MYSSMPQPRCPHHTLPRRPAFVEDDEPPQLAIKGGRHPMLDAQLAGAAVPNDLQLGWAGQRAAIVTGPNMGGKSCLIRQAALLVIMAQVGCAGCAEGYWCCELQ
jgi:DNA mismatch repair protein MSH3